MIKLAYLCKSKLVHCPPHVSMARLEVPPDLQTELKSLLLLPSIPTLVMESLVLYSRLTADVSDRRLFMKLLHVSKRSCRRFGVLVHAGVSVIGLFIQS